MILVTPWERARGHTPQDGLGALQVHIWASIIWAWNLSISEVIDCKQWPHISLKVARGAAVPYARWLDVVAS